MKRTLTFDNAEALVTLADRFCLPDLQAHHRRFILDNFLAFAETTAFLEMDHRTLLPYLKDDSLRTPTEGKLYKCLIRWYEHKKESREKYIHLVMDTVRYTQEGWPLIEYAEEREPFLSNKKCKEMVKFWNNYMKNPERSYLVQSYRTRVRHDRQTLILLGGLCEAGSGDSFERLMCANAHAKFFHRDTRS